MSNSSFNPFARSQLKMVEPLSLVSCQYDGWSELYNLEYRASRSAANVGLLGKQFKVGTPLVVNGKHMVVREANLTLTKNTVDEVTIRVIAVDFAAILKSATQPAKAISPPPNQPAVAKPALPQFGPIKRRILK